MPKSLIKTLFAGFVLGLLSLAAPAYADLITDDCNQALHTVPGSYMSFVQKAEERHGNSAEKHPEYLNPVKEKDLVKQWQGAEMPALLAPFLPEGATLISHSLKKASAPGVVKVEQSGGDFLMLRVEMEFKGRMIATNVTVNAQALFHNIDRYRRGEQRWLIGPDATAALDWGHGGGTKTTGGHTVDTLMNNMSKYNVFTVGMDQPFHGNGPRDWFENEMEYFEYRVAFRKRFIHPDVPTFMVGHSFGGEIGDMAIRRSGKGFEKLGLKEAYAGIIPLSFVPDPDPTSPDFESKTTASKIKDAQQKWNSVAKWINEGDLDLFASLMGQDKCSALSGLQCTQIGLYNIWKMDDNILPQAKFLESYTAAAQALPGEGQAPLFQAFLSSDKQQLAEGPIPSLWVMGEHDALYVQHEENIETYVRRYKNAMLWTFASRVTFRGKVEKVGHMIFDHYMPKKDSPEAVQMMASFLRSKNSEREVPTEQDALVALFKAEVLNDVIRPYTYLTPINNLPSSLALLAYQWNPEFTAYLDRRIADLAIAKGKKVGDIQPDYFIDNYSERGVFETYSIIRDFVATVLKMKGVDLKEMTAGDRIDAAKAAGHVLGHSREAILHVLKAYGNNLAFREYLNELTFMEIPATPEFQALNETGEAITQRVREMETIRKNKHMSDEEKQARILELGPIVNDRGEMLSADNREGMQEALDRINMIRNKKFIPNDENRDFVLANIERRNQLVIDGKALEHKREGFKKTIKALRDQQSKKENALNRLTATLTSPRLTALEERRQAFYDELETYDLKQRTVVEAHVVKLLNQGQSWSAIFANLPDDVQKVFVDTERASQSYQALLKEIEAVKKTEAQNGNLGPEAEALAEELYGDNSLAKQIAGLSRELDETEYVEIAAVKAENDKLLEAYIERVLSKYFAIRWVSVREALETPTVDNEHFRDLFKALETGYSLWRSKVVTSKPTEEATGLY